MELWTEFDNLRYMLRETTIPLTDEANDGILHSNVSAGERGREEEQGCDISATSLNHCTLGDLLDTNSLKIPADRSIAIIF